MMWSLLLVLAFGARVRGEDTAGGDAEREGGATADAMAHGKILPQLDLGLRQMLEMLEGMPERLAEDPMLLELAAQNVAVAALVQDGASLEALQQTLRSELDPAKIEKVLQEVSQAVQAVAQLMQAPEFRHLVAEEDARLKEEPDFQQLLRVLEEMQAKESARKAEAEGQELKSMPAGAAPFVSSLVETEVKGLPSARAMKSIARANNGPHAPSNLLKARQNIIPRRSVEVDSLKIDSVEPGPENAPPRPESARSSSPDEAMQLRAEAVDKALALRGGGLGSRLGAVKEAYQNLPSITRSWFSLSLGFAALNQAGVLEPEKIALDAHAVAGGQIWRPITAASFFGGLGPQLLQKMFNLVSYGRKLEDALGLGGFLRTLASMMSMLTLLATKLGWPLLGDALIAAVTVLACKQTPDAVVSMYGLKLPMDLMPVANLVLSYLFTQQIPWMDIAGSAVGYLHYHLQDEAKPDAAYYEKHAHDLKNSRPGARTLGGKKNSHVQRLQRSSFIQAAEVNGDTQGPISAKALAQMGVDPAKLPPEVMAELMGPGQSKPDKNNDQLKVTLGALVALYLSNNWNQVGPLVEAASKLVKRR